MDDSAPVEEARFPQVWVRFERWLSRNAPEDHRCLRPGASRGEVAALEEGIGFPVDDRLKSLLSVHNGVTPRRSSTQGGAFVLGYSLLGTDGVLEEQRYLARTAREAAEEGYEDEVVGLTAHERWVPFAQSLTGDLLFVDHRDGHEGQVGEISFGSPGYQRLWDSLTQMFDALSASVETTAPLPGLGRLPRVHEARMLEWVAP
jgi:cell wall assembly regulator SMI1